VMSVASVLRSTGIVNPFTQTEPFLGLLRRSLIASSSCDALADILLNAHFRLIIITVVNFEFYC